MTLRQWCQREGHPLAVIVMGAEVAAVGATQRMERRGRACVCGHRADFEHEGPTPGYLALPRSAIDAEGPERC